MKESRVRELLTDYQDSGDIEARDIVVLAHQHLCDWWVGKYRVPSHLYLDKDDIMGLAHIALLEACDRYDPQRPNSNFSSLAIARIRTLIYREVVQGGQVKGREAERRTDSIDRVPTGGDSYSRSIDAPSNTNCQYGWDALDPPDHSEHALVTDMAQRIRDLAPEVLTSKQYEIYRLRFEMGLMHEQIGEQLGISKQRASYVAKRVGLKLRNAIERELRLQESE